MKSAHRFDYARFGEALVERGLLDRNVLSHVLHQCNATRMLMTELLVRENLVSDWELSRVACELYHLPFLTTALDGYDLGYLRHYALVPLDRFGGLVTVAMPGLVPSEVLDGLRPGQNGRVLAVVASVVSNRRWLEGLTPAGAPAKGAPAAKGGTPAKGGATPAKTISMSPPQEAAKLSEVPGAIPAAELEEAASLQIGSGDEWGNLFDAGEEAVQLDLKKPRRP